MTASAIEGAQEEFRQASRRDIPAIVALLADDELGAGREVASADLDPRYGRAFADMCSQGGNELLVMVQGGEIVACLQFVVIPGLSRLGAKRAQIEGVRVARTHRHGGFGNRLMRHAIERARDAGCTLVQLTTDKTRTEAYAFYLKLGFEPSHVGMKLAL